MPRAICIAVVLLLTLGHIGAIRQPAGLYDAAALRHSEELNLRPLIGILTETGDPALHGHTYIAASYVRFVQAAGARAVPIQCDLPPHEIQRRFTRVNGVLIPGGGQELSPGHPYFDATAQLLELARKANDAGHYFPVQATCLGFEAVSVAVARNTSLLDAYDGYDNPSKLRLALRGGGSRFWRGLPRSVRRDLLEREYTMENHSQGLSVAAYAASQRLRDFFRVISTSVDKQGKVFISTMEAKQYPITATQWHPEKNAFEWNGNMHIPHEPGAVDVTLAVARLFVNQARRNFQAPSSQEELEELLVYNWPVVYTGKRGPSGEKEGYFDECYFFPPEHRRPRLKFEVPASAAGSETS